MEAFAFVDDMESDLFGAPSPQYATLQVLSGPRQCQSVCVACQHECPATADSLCNGCDKALHASCGSRLGGGGGSFCPSCAANADKGTVCPCV